MCSSSYHGCSITDYQFGAKLLFQVALLASLSKASEHSAASLAQHVVVNAGAALIHAPHSSHSTHDGDSPQGSLLRRAETEHVLARTTTTTTTTTRLYWHFDQRETYIPFGGANTMFHPDLDLTVSGIKEFCKNDENALKFAVRCKLASDEASAPPMGRSQTRPWTWIGCYRDMPMPRAMPEGPNNPLYSTKSCMKACQGYLYFSLQNTWCNCGNTTEFKTWGKAKDEDCGLENPSDPYWGRLGRNWRMAVYSTESSDFAAGEQCKTDTVGQRCDSLKAMCGKAMDVLCNKWQECGTCPSSETCLYNQCVNLANPLNPVTPNSATPDQASGGTDGENAREEASPFSKPGENPERDRANAKKSGSASKQRELIRAHSDIFKLKELMAAVGGSVNKTASILEFLYPELYALEGMANDLEGNETAMKNADDEKQQEMWKAIQGALETEKGAEEKSTNIQLVTKKALDAFAADRRKSGIVSKEEIELARSALKKAEAAIGQSLQVNAQAKQAKTQASTAAATLARVLGSDKVIGEGVGRASQESNQAYFEVETADGAVRASALDAKNADDTAGRALQLSKEAGSTSEKAIADSTATLAFAEEGNKVNQEALAKLLASSQQIEKVEVLQKGQVKAAQRTRVSTRRAVQQEEKAQAEVQTAAKETQQVQKNTGQALATAGRAMQEARQTETFTAKAEKNVRKLRQETAMAFRAGAIAVKKSAMEEKAAKSAVKEGAVAVEEGRVAVKEAKQAEAAVKAVSKQAAAALVKSKASIEASKKAEGATKESFQEAQVAQKAAVAAQGEAAGALVETKKTTEQVAALTGELRGLESHEAKLMGVIKVLEKQSGQNKGTVNTMEKQEVVMEKTLTTIAAQTKTLDKTVTWASALTEGLQNQQTVLDRHSQAVKKGLSLDQAQSKALEKQQTGMEKQQQILNKTVKWVKTLADGVEAHQTALEKHQEHLVSDVESTSKNLVNLQKNEAQLEDTQKRLNDLEHKDAAGLMKLSGESAQYATKAEVNVSLTKVQKHLNTAEANMLAINRRSLASKSQDMYLVKRADVLDANVQNMKRELTTASAHAKANAQMLNVIEANEREARHDMHDGMRSIQKSEHDAVHFAQNQENLKKVQEHNAKAAVAIQEGQVRNKEDMKKVVEHQDSLKEEADSAALAAQNAQLQIAKTEKADAELQKEGIDLQKRLNTALEGAGNKTMIQNIKDQIDKLENREKVEGQEIQKASVTAKMSKEAKERTEKADKQLGEMEEKGKVLEEKQEKLLRATAFGVVCVVVSTILLACYLLSQLNALSEKVHAESGGDH